MAIPFYKNRQPASSAFLLLTESSFAISRRASSVIAWLIANDIAPGGDPWRAAEGVPRRHLARGMGLSMRRQGNRRCGGTSQLALWRPGVCSFYRSESIFPERRLGSCGNRSGVGRDRHRDDRVLVAKWLGRGIGQSQAETAHPQFGGLGDLSKSPALRST